MEEGSSGMGEKEEEEFAETTERNNMDTSFSVYPCYLLQQALNHLFKCFGLEIGTNSEQNTSSSLVAKPKPEDSATNGLKCSEEELVPTSINAEGADNQEENNSATQNFELSITRVMLRRGRPGLSSGSGGQIN